MTELLKLSELEVSFGGLNVLRGASFEVQQGEIIGVIGPNGSGKTTLFNCISGFVRPDQGSIHFREKRIDQLSTHHRARLGIGRVFQNFGVFREMTVGENLLLAYEGQLPWWQSLLPWTPQRKVFRTKHKSCSAKLGSVIEKILASNLSGGQLRLLEIIRMVAFGAELLLLDEPTAGVAPKMKNHVAELIQKLHQRGNTVMVIEHDLDFIQSFCSRIVVLDGGKIVLDGAPDVVRHDPKLEEIYLGKELRKESDQVTSS